MIQLKQKIVILSGAIYSTFSSSEWTEIGYLTDTDEWIDAHPRLLRSLHWGDPDYKGHVFDAVSHILSKNPDNFRKLLEYQPITEWLKQNNAGAYQEPSAEAFGADVAEIIPRSSTASGFVALADAQSLLRTRGPTSAVDRVHTALHAFLKAACDESNIDYPNEPTANQLLKALIEKHPALTETRSQIRGYSQDGSG